MKTEVKIEGNTYFISGSDSEGYKVTKSHAGGNKVVGDPAKIKQVIELAKKS